MVGEDFPRFRGELERGSVRAVIVVGVQPLGLFAPRPLDVVQRRVPRDPEAGVVVLHAYERRSADSM